MRCADGDVLEEAGVGIVVAVLVGQDPGHVGRCRRLDESRLLLRRRPGAHGDDEGILALERFYEGRLVVVGNLFDVHTSGHCVRAICTGDGGDFVLADFEQLFYNVFPDSTAGLLGY